MTHIRYNGVVYNLPATSGTYLCDAIEVALSRGLTFFVELGTSTEYPDLQQAIFLHPGVSLELARIRLPEDTYREDIRQALVELAESDASTMQLIPLEWDREEIEKFRVGIRERLNGEEPLSPGQDD